MIKGKTGTRELSKFSLNAGKGCGNQCRYCYARYNACYGRFKTMTEVEHMTFVPNNDRINKPAKKMNGVIMFPTVHDITPDNLNDCMTMIRKNLDKGNEMLIVSKANTKCFDLMTKAYADYKSQLHFMVTIGSICDDVLKFWDTEAPSFDDRLTSLVMAYSRGYKTSVLCEPMLDAFPTHLYAACVEYVTESIWFGMLNKMDQRCDFTGVSEADMKYIQVVRETHNKTFIKCMYELMKDYPKIKFKDSITKLLGLEETE